MYLLLSIVTCGIYSIWFWYKYSEDMNIVCNGDGKTTQNYIIVLLLSIVTCGIYQFFWFYGLGNRLQENSGRYGVAMSENGSTVLMWMIFGSLLCGIGTFFAFHILIKNMNILAARYSDGSGSSQY